MTTRSKMMNNRYMVSGELRSKLIKEVGACENCGYSNFMEVLELAHIIHGHEIEKLVRKNTFLLCPTCHRCFDRGLIEINREVSDCHLVKYKSSNVLFKTWTKIDKLKKKTKVKWKSGGDGRFYISSK